MGEIGVLGVWAAEGFENSRKFFGPSESLRLHYFNVGKRSGTPRKRLFLTDFFSGAQTPSQLLLANAFAKSLAAELAALLGWEPACIRRRRHIWRCPDGVSFVSAKFLCLEINFLHLFHISVLTGQ